MPCISKSRRSTMNSNYPAPWWRPTMKTIRRRLIQVLPMISSMRKPTCTGLATSATSVRMISASTRPDARPMPTCARVFKIHPARRTVLSTANTKRLIPNFRALYSPLSKRPMSLASTWKERISISKFPTSFLPARPTTSRRSTAFIFRSCRG